MWLFCLPLSHKRTPGLYGLRTYVNVVMKEVYPSYAESLICMYGNTPLLSIDGCMQVASQRFLPLVLRAVLDI